MKEEILVGNAFEGKLGSHGGRAILLSHMQGLEPFTVASLTRQC